MSMINLTGPANVEHFIINSNQADKVKIDRLLTLFDSILRAEGNLEVVEICLKNCLKKIQKCLPLIFTESRKRPFEHTRLTYNIGKLAEILKKHLDHSIKLKMMQEDLHTVYQHMTRLIGVAAIKLVDIPELDQRIVRLMLLSYEKIDNVAISKAKALCYAYSFEDLYCSENGFPKIEDLVLEKFNAPQANKSKEIFLRL